MVIVAESDQYEATSEYTVATSQASTTTVSPTSLTSTNAPSSTSLNPSPTIPELPATIAIAFLVAAMLSVSVAVKRNRAKMPF